MRFGGLGLLFRPNARRVHLQHGANSALGCCYGWSIQTLISMHTLNFFNVRFNANSRAVAWPVPHCWLCNQDLSCHSRFTSKPRGFDEVVSSLIQIHYSAFGAQDQAIASQQSAVVWCNAGGQADLPLLWLWSNCSNASQCAHA